ncbi:MAG: hypothetical protein ACNI3A_09490 [Desulfovibrio sp.]|uniref:hypothetical protein n=1 Tax=Desulfovibrio sp. 7SRBS1 TaxID=3378064 RepID=UPI003B410DE8
MAYDIKLVKLINGDNILGKWDEEGHKLTDVAVLQTVPTQQGVQMMLLPFGYPFETEITGEIDARHIMYVFEKFPEELKTKYMEATSNLTLSTPGDLHNLQNLGGQGGMGSFSDLLKK